MKIIVAISLTFFSLFILGCASSSGVDSASEEAPGVTQPTDKVGAKTAYEGSTGSGLLMERYKSGQIEGYRK